MEPTLGTIKNIFQKYLKICMRQVSIKEKNIKKSCILGRQDIFNVLFSWKDKYPRKKKLKNHAFPKIQVSQKIHPTYRNKQRTISYTQFSPFAKIQNTRSCSPFTKQLTSISLYLAFRNTQIHYLLCLHLSCLYRNSFRM